MKVTVYDPLNKKVRFDGKEYDFFCGAEFNEIAWTLFRLKYGDINIQKSYDMIVYGLVNSSLKPKIDEPTHYEKEIKYEGENEPTM